ncbi:MAG TPA: hypothetical protein VLA97_06195 [Nocardioidaceae bacterium]|nr:hypothetical protein [Nocardioidaceae bacterium]
MNLYSSWRGARPGWWLVAGLVAALAVYTTAAERSAPVSFWPLIDLWLAHRVWRGGATALAWFRGLQGAGAVIFGVVLVLDVWSGGFVATTGPGTAALYALSAWCLMAPALTQHVAASSARGPLASATPR